MPRPTGTSAEINRDFRKWLKKRKVIPGDIVPGAGQDWSKISYNPKASWQKEPGIFYWSKRYLHYCGIENQKKITDMIRKLKPKAGIGANYSPHHGAPAHAYLGKVHQWVKLFRRQGMTQPWSEDYIYQLPVGSPQMNAINLDLFRAGIRHLPNEKIHYYVMPHWPGSPPSIWRRQFFGDLAHGMKVVNLFEFRPCQEAYTENYCNYWPTYAEIRKSFYELGTFEDLIQSGQVQPAQTALWFSETADIWGDYHDSFAAAKRGMYIAIRHLQLPLDFVIEDDAVDGTLNKYKLLYLTDCHVDRQSSKAIAAWVENGGILFATAGAGMYDEYHQPNKVMQKLLGIVQQKIVAPENSKVIYMKQDLAFARKISEVNWKSANRSRKIPAYGAICLVTNKNAEISGTFTDKKPAVTTRQVGKGKVVYCAFMPSLSYFKPAIPLKPVDRSSSLNSMSHLIPTKFNADAEALIGSVATQIKRPVICSNPLVATTVIKSPNGMVIPLINWTNKPIKGLKVVVTIKTPSGSVTTASGKPVIVTKEQGKRIFLLDLNAADALILRDSP